MQVDVREQRADTPTLHGSDLSTYVLTLVEHARPQPFLDQVNDSNVCEPRRQGCNIGTELEDPFECTSNDVDMSGISARIEGDLLALCHARVVPRAEGEAPRRQPRWSRPTSDLAQTALAPSSAEASVGGHAVRLAWYMRRGHEPCRELGRKL